MLILEWVILISVCLAVFTTVVILFFLMLVLTLKKQGTYLRNNKPKKRRDVKRWRKKQTVILNEQSKRKKSVFFLVVILLISIGTGGYSSYYLKTNMTEVDTENIVSGYYLLDQVTQQLENVTKDEEKSEQITANVHTLAVRMASYATKKGSDRGSEEAQLLLNRYYARIGQFGVNLSSQDYKEMKENPEIITMFQNDVAGIRKGQKKILNFFKIDEQSLRQKK